MPKASQNLPETGFTLLAWFFSAITMYKRDSKYQLKYKLYVIALSLVAACIDQQVGIITWQLAERGQSSEFLHYIFTVISINKVV